MKHIPIIAFAGRSKSGKDFAARCANSYIERSVIRKFADPIKNALRAMGVPEEYVDGDRKDSIAPVIKVVSRDWQINYARWMRGQYGDDFFVRSLSARMNKMETTIISDVRYPVEVEFILANGGVIIQVDRPSLPEQVEPIDDSERGIGEVPGLIHLINRDNADEFRQEVSSLVQQLTARLTAESMFFKSMACTAKAIREVNAAHGWRTPCREEWPDKEMEPDRRERLAAMFLAKHALICSEVAEMTEAVRDGDFEKWIKEGSDVAIRLMDLIYGAGGRLAEGIVEKNDENVGRPYKHAKDGVAKAI